MTIHLADATPLLPVCLHSLSLPPSFARSHLHLLVPRLIFFVVVVVAHDQESVGFHFSAVRLLGGGGISWLIAEEQQPDVSHLHTPPRTPPLTKGEINPAIKMVVEVVVVAARVGAKWRPWHTHKKIGRTLKNKSQLCGARCKGSFILLLRCFQTPLGGAVDLNTGRSLGCTCCRQSRNMKPCAKLKVGCVIFGDFEKKQEHRVVKFEIAALFPPPCLS